MFSPFLDRLMNRKKGSSSNPGNSQERVGVEGSANTARTENNEDGLGFEKVELINIGGGNNGGQSEKSASEPSTNIDILGYSNNYSRAYGIYSKDRVHIGIFGETGA